MFKLALFLIVVINSNGPVVNSAAIHSDHSGCSIKCDSEWTTYKADIEYTYSFNVKQKLSIAHRLFRQGYNDTQSLALEGQFHLTRSKINVCSVNIRFSNAIVTFNQMNNNESRQESLNLEKLSILSNKGELCLPEADDPWKNNLRRSIISHLYHISSFPSASSCDVTSTENTQLTTLPKLGNKAPCFINWGNGTSRIWMPELPIITYLHLEDYEGTLDPPEEITFSDRSTLKEEIMRKLFERQLSYKVQICTQSTKAAELTSSCFDEEIISGELQLMTRSTSNSEVVFESQTSLGNQVNLNVDTTTLLKTKLFELSSPDFSYVTNDSKVIDTFMEKTLGEICQIVGENVEEIHSYFDRTKKIFKFIPLYVLQKAYSHIQANCSEKAQKLFLNFASHTSTDDAVEFLVDILINSNSEIDEEILTNFLWASTMLTDVEYAGPKSVNAMKTLLQNWETIKNQVEMTTKEFLLHAVGFLQRVRKISMAIEMGNYMIELESLLAKHKKEIDRGTQLEIRRHLNDILNDGNDEECKEIAKNDFELLKCYRPCDKKHANFLSGIMNGKETPRDLKVVAYLFMRKCYIDEWRDIVKNYLATSDKDEKDVKIFIKKHSSKTEISDMTNEYDSDEKPDFSVGESHHECYDDRTLYGLDPCRAEISLNAVHGEALIPRMFIIDFMNHGVIPQQFIFEMLRTGLDGGYGAEFWYTLSINGTTVWTSDCKIEMNEILKLFENNGAPLKKLLASWYLQNGNLISKILKQQSVSLSQLVMHEDMMKVISTISPLPLKMTSSASSVALFNYTLNLNQNTKFDVMGNWSAEIDLHSSFAAKSSESLVVDMSTEEPLGYAAHLGLNAQLNFGFLFSHSMEEGFKFKIRFSTDKNQLKEPFVAFGFDILKVTRVQTLDAFTIGYESDHIWPEKDQDDEEQRLENAVFHPFTKYSEQLGNAGCQYNARIDGFFESKPFMLSVDSFCRLPDINLDIKPTFEGWDHALLDIKLYPSNSTTENSFAFKAHLDRKSSYGDNVKLNAQLKVETPSRKFDLYANLEDHRSLEGLGGILSFGVNLGPETELGMEMFIKHSPPLKYSMNADTNRNSFSTNPKVNFGIKVKTPFPGWEKISILEGQSFYTTSSMSFQIESKGIHPYLNTQFEVSTELVGRTASDASAILHGIELPLVLNGSLHKSFIEAENDYFGFLSAKEMTFVADNNRDGFFYYLSNSTYEIAYGGLDSEIHTISGEHGRKWYKERRMGLFRYYNARWTQYPFLDFNVTTQKNLRRPLVPEDSDPYAADPYANCPSNGYATDITVETKLTEKLYWKVYLDTAVHEGVCHTITQYQAFLNPHLNFRLTNFESFADGATYHRMNFRGEIDRNKAVANWKYCAGGKLCWEFEDEHEQLKALTWSAIPSRPEYPDLKIDGEVFEEFTLSTHSTGHHMQQLSNNEFSYNLWYAKDPPGLNFSAIGLVETGQNELNSISLKLTEKNWPHIAQVTMKSETVGNMKEYKVAAKKDQQSYFKSSAKFDKSSDSFLNKVPTEVHAESPVFNCIFIRTDDRLRLETEVAPMNADFKFNVHFPSSHDTLSAKFSSCSLHKPTPYNCGSFNFKSSLLKQDDGRTPTSNYFISPIVSNYVFHSNVSMSYFAKTYGLLIDGQLHPGRNEGDPLATLQLVYPDPSESTKKKHFDVLLAAHLSREYTLAFGNYTFGTYLIFGDTVWKESNPVKLGGKGSMAFEFSGSQDGEEKKDIEIIAASTTIEFKHNDYFVPWKKTVVTSTNVSYTVTDTFNENKISERIGKRSIENRVGIYTLLKSHSQQNDPDYKEYFVSTEGKTLLAENTFDVDLKGFFQRNSFFQKSFEFNLLSEKSKDSSNVSKQAHVKYSIDKEWISGDHVLNSQFYSWRNFKIRSNNTISLDKETAYEWEDNIKINLDNDGDNDMKFSSSKLFQLEVHPNPKKLEIEGKVLYPALESEIQLLLQKQPPMLSIEGKSPLAPHPLSIQYRGHRPESTDGAEWHYWNHVNWTLPISGFKGTFANSIREYEQKQGDFSIVAVHHQAIFKPESSENWANEWKSVSTVLSEKSMPVLLNYEFKWHNVFSNEKLTSDWSISSPSLIDKAPQIFRGDVKSLTHSIYEGTDHTFSNVLLRLGQIDESKCVKQNRSILGDLSDALPRFDENINTGKSNVNFDFDMIKQLRLNKLHCGFCNGPSNNCESSKGQFIVQKILLNKEVDDEATLITSSIEDLRSIPSFINGVRSSSTWNSQNCDAYMEEFYPIVEEERNTHKDLSNICRITVKRMDPCANELSPENDNCPAKQNLHDKEKEIWNKLATRNAPRKIVLFDNAIWFVLYLGL